MSGKPKHAELEHWEQGLALARNHPLFGALLNRCQVLRPKPQSEGDLCPKSGWAVVTEGGAIYLHSKRSDTPAEWAYVLAHCALHLAFEHFHKRPEPHVWNATACAVVTRFLEGLKFGRAPEEMLHLDELPARPEREVYEEWCLRGVPEGLRSLSAAGPGASDLYFVSQQPGRYAGWGAAPGSWAGTFADGLRRAVDAALTKASGEATPARQDTVGHRARNWFVNHYPLLGALAVSFKIIEDPIILARMQVAIGAVDPGLQEIYLNSQRLDDEQARFVMAHELLHVGLRHEARRQGRDPFLWNVACDYVINAWLIEMGVGRLPLTGVLHDPTLTGLSAEAIYDRIATDLRRARKLATLRGQGLGDLLDSRSPGWWRSGPGCDLDAFYRSCLAQGLEYHQAQGRGLVPAGLVEEIRALAQPPIAWDVQLARLFDSWFTPLERVRSYARPSRRQSSTPDIPRPRLVLPQTLLEARTFAVVLDTSGSMDRELLGRALGAIASYAAARDVPAARVIYCDAAAYDAGYLPVEQLAYAPVKVRGRGGTVLQPGLDLLDRARDFPSDGPVLVITDGACDDLTVKRRHAFLLPEGRSLPFAPAGPVFRMG